MSQVPAAAGSAVSPLPAALARILSEVARAAARVDANGWAEGAAGNLSIDLTGLLVGGHSAHEVPLESAFPGLAGRRLLLTASGARMRDLSRDPERGVGVVQVAADGRRLAAVWTRDRRQFRPTSELTVHLAIQGAMRRRGLPTTTVLHVHADALVALTHHPKLGTSEDVTDTLAGMLTEVTTLLPEGIGVLPYLAPGSLEQAVATAAACEHHRLVLWPRHGVVATGSTLAECLDLLEAAEKAARMWLTCSTGGFGPTGAGQGRPASQPGD
jgi:rhamnulose-1-phosphate aldolase